jgi:hypothetical protein
LPRAAIAAITGTETKTPVPANTSDGHQTIHSLPPPAKSRSSGKIAPPPAARPSNPALTRPSGQTLPHVVPPPPAEAPRVERAETDQDDRLDKARKETEVITSVEVDAEAKAKAKAKAQAQAEAEVRADSDTDTGMAATSASAGPTDTDQMEALARGDNTDSAVSTMPVDKVEREDSSPIGAPKRASTEAVKVNELLSRLTTVAPPEEDRARASEPKLPTRQSESKLPISTASPSLPPPKDAQVAASGPTPACPQCESPMVWVEEHLRFYCKQCRMYF